MPAPLTRRHLLVSAASVAAVAAMPAAMAIAAVEGAPMSIDAWAAANLTMDPGLQRPVRAYSEGYRATTVLRKMFFERETV